MKILTNPLLWLVMKSQRKPLLVIGSALLVWFFVDAIATTLYRVVYIATTPLRWFTPFSLKSVDEAATFIHKPLVQWGIVALAFWGRQYAVGWLVAAWNIRTAIKATSSSGTSAAAPSPYAPPSSGSSYPANDGMFPPKK